MSNFDIISLIIIACFGLFGLWFGLIHTAGSLLGMVLGVFLASRYYEPVANWIIQRIGLGENISKVLVFIVAFFIINRVVGLAFWIIEKFLRIITGLPFIKSINHFLGMILGIFEGAIGLGIVFYFIARFPIGENFMKSFSESHVAPYLVNFAKILLPLVPEALKIIKSSIDGVI